jgi:hypothetical protein
MTPALPPYPSPCPHISPACRGPLSHALLRTRSVSRLALRVTDPCTVLFSVPYWRKRKLTTNPARSSHSRSSGRTTCGGGNSAKKRSRPQSWETTGGAHVGEVHWRADSHVSGIVPIARELASVDVSSHLEDGGHPLATADAHGLEPVAPFAAT